MNALAKGKRYEIKSKKMLEHAGWIVEKPIWSRFSGKDFFGVFDLMAVKKGEKMLWVQVKTLRCAAKEEQRIADFCRRHLDPVFHTVVLHIWRPYKNVEVKRII